MTTAASAPWPSSSRSSESCSTSSLALRAISSSTAFITAYWPGCVDRRRPSRAAFVPSDRRAGERGSLPRIFLVGEGDAMGAAPRDAEGGKTASAQHVGDGDAGGEGDGGRPMRAWLGGRRARLHGVEQVRLPVLPVVPLKLAL